MAAGVLIVTRRMDNEQVPSAQPGRLLMGVCARLADAIGAPAWVIRVVALALFVLTLGLPIALAYLMYANYLNYKEIEASYDLVDCERQVKNRSSIVTAPWN